MGAEEFLEYVSGSKELIEYKKITMDEIKEQLKGGKYLIWIDDKESKDLTPEYMEENSMLFADDFEKALKICTTLQGLERTQYGICKTRFRIDPTNYVCSEDLTEDKAGEIIENIEKTYGPFPPPSPPGT
jgi:hypothetical protein